MKKTILLFLSILLFSNFLYSSEKLYSFVGVQSSISKFDNSYSPTLDLKYGKQSKNIRSTIIYSYGQSHNSDFQSLILQIDSAILASRFTDIAYKPYLGLSLGGIQQNNSKLLSQHDRGLAYGINGGLSYVLNTNTDLNLEYRFLKTSNMEFLNQVNNISISMHYFY